MPEAKMHIEQRSNPRISVIIPVKYRVIEEPKEHETVTAFIKKQLTTKTADVSLGGLYIMADHVPNIDSVLALEISLPGNSSPIAAFAKVVWSNATGGGLHFLSIKNEDVDSLNAYLAKVSKAN